MRRFAMMLLQGLSAAGVQTALITPEPLFGRFRMAGAFVNKWMAYIDKFIVFPRLLRSRLKTGIALVHICDHSNAMYSRQVHGIPVVTTCHDLLAARGALGEATDCPASLTGKVLQRWIVSGLEKSAVVSCVSKATLADAERLLKKEQAQPRLEQIPLGLSYPYRPLTS